MNKIGFLLSGILSLMGVWVLFATNIINSLLPKIGYAAFQAAAAGSYNPGNYVIDFTGVNIFAVIGIITGIFLMVFFYTIKKGGKMN